MARIVFGNHPFTAEKKEKPMCIRKEACGYFTYPDFEICTSDLNTLYLSTPEMTVGYYELAPGSKFAPPDHHPGDEIYYIMEGELWEVNPITGQNVHLMPGDALLIPFGAAHGGYNFGKTRMKAVFALAPNMVTGQNFPTDLTGKWRVLKGKDEGAYEKFSDVEKKNVIQTIDHVGRWPVSGQELRQFPGYLRRITEYEKLNVVNGLENPYLMKFFISNDLIHMGELILPSGGKGCRISEPESHAGETAVFVLDGSISFLMTESRETFKVEPGELMYIPKGVEYQMMNYWEEFARAIFVIAPAL